jgi:hypothetical protein
MVDKKIAEKIAMAGEQLGVVCDVREGYQPMGSPYNTRVTGVVVMSWAHFAAAAAQAACESSDKDKLIDELMGCDSDSLDYSGIIIFRKP